ncbi:LOW QUALITY PROTEIN: nestin [Bufo gargarizans]|uniref:LOW QUALITY PROTEIN: nestin n=1 Tax=Bufo gargarizans TaxID=30331 RepID=UPI001CF49F0D|nr:LOW QUALITY PROTEIN: nestin [Bufo gargarizans]
METYSASISLGEESAQMWRLNKRLEAFLSRVKALEEENELLRTEILHLKSTKSNRSIIREYHDEIMKLRDTLDDGHQEMVQVETDRDCIYQEIEYVKELCLQEKQTQEDVKKELSESKKLLEEEKRAQIWLKERLIHLEEEMEDILKVHEEEKAQMEEEISSYSQRLENLKIAPANFKPVNVEDYANQLSQIWQGAVEEYKIEVSALEANLSQAKDNLQKVLDENKQSQIQLQNLERDLQSLKSRKEMLEELLGKQWLEQQDEEGELQLEIETLEKEKKDLRVQIAQVLEDRQQLMHLKMSLSLEVATYRSLLETESTRLYTPSADYKVASSFSDSLLEQKSFRKSRNENTKPLVSRDNRLNKRQSAETSTDRYINVKSTSFSNKASPVTKEFQKVSSVLQSQGLKYTKASSATLPPAESSLGRHIQNRDVFKKSKVETISHFQDFSKPVTKETVRKDADIEPVLNGKAYNTTDTKLNKRDLMSDAKDESLTPTANETVSAQVESSLRPEAKHIEIISDFGLEEKHFVEAPKTDKETLVFEKHNKEKIDFEVPIDNGDHPSEDFGNIDEEHIIGKQEVVRQIVSCQRVYIEKEELVEPLEYENIETSVKVNNEEFRKVLDFSKPNTQDLDEPHVLSSDGVSDQGIEYTLSQELDFDTQGSLNNADVENASQDKEDIHQEVDEEKENSQLNKGLETSNYVEAKVDLQVEDMSVDQKLPVLSSLMEDVNQLIDDGQNFTKDIQDIKTTEKEDYNENHEKDTEVLQDTNIQVYNDNELDQQASRQEDNVFKADQCIDSKEEHTQFEQERQEVHDRSESMDHLSDEEVFKTGSKKEEEESCECEENIINAEQNVQDFIDTEQSSILVVKEVYQYSSQVRNDLQDLQNPSLEEKNNFQLNDREQNTQSYEDQQKDFAKAPEETAQVFSDSNQEESKDQENKNVFDQRDNVQVEVSQLSEDVSGSQKPDLEELMSGDFSGTEQESQGTGGYFVEHNQVVQTSDSKEGDSLQEINSDSKQEELHDIMQEEMVISVEKHEDLQKLETEKEQSDINLHSVQSTPEHNIQSSEGEELERDGQLLEKDLTEEETTVTNTNSVETITSELKDVEEDKDNISEENLEVCTTVEYTKLIKTEVIAKSIDDEFESYEDNATEKEGLTPAFEEDISKPEHEAEKEQEQGKEHYQVVSIEEENRENKDKEEDKQLFQESDVQLNIAKEEGSLLQQDTEPIVERRSEVSTDMEQDNAKLHDHQDSEVDKDQPSDRETSFQQESEDLIQSDEGHKESSKVTLTAEEYSVSNEVDTQSIEKDYDIMEEAQANSTMETDRNVKLKKVVESEPEEKSRFQQEVEKKEEEEQASNNQEVEERQESYNQDVETGQELEEGTEIYHQELADGKGDYHQEVEITQKVEERQDDHHQDSEEGKECYHQEVEGQEGYHQEVQDDVEQNVGVSLKIFPNFLRFTSAQTQSEQEQSTKFSDEGTETHVDEIHVHREEQTENDLILEDKIKEQEVCENEIIHQQSTFPLEHERNDILSENSESQVAENLTEKNDFDVPTDKNLTEFNEMEQGDNMDKDNSKSEDSMDSQEGYHQETEETQEGFHQEVKVGEEGYHQEDDDQLGIVENIASEEDHSRNQSLQKDSDVEQNVGVSLKIFPNILRFTSEHDAETQPEQGQSSTFSDEGTETYEDEIHVHGEDQTKDDLILEDKIKEQEVCENEIIHQQSTFPLEHERNNILSENSESQVVLSENLTEKNDFDVPTDKNLTEFNEMEEGDNIDKDNSKSEDPMDSQEGYHQETKETQEGFHQEVKVGEEGYHQEDDDQLGIVENIASEEDHSMNQSIQKDSDVEQNVGVSLKIFPNILRFTSEHDAETQPEQGQSSTFSDEGTETYGDEIHVHGEDQTKDELILAEKKQVLENEIIHQQSTFPLENEQENILLENSESQVVLSENLTEKHDFDAPIDKNLTEFNKTDKADNMDKDNSKSEDPMDSQEGYYQKTEETQEGHHQEVEVGEEGNHQEEDQLGVEAISTLNENISSEVDHRRNQSIQNDSDVEQNVRVSLKIFPNILQFTSENYAEAQTEQQEQKRELSYKGTETSEDEIHQEKFENIEQNDIVLEASEQEISENEIIQPQSTFPLELECENLLLENSKTHVVLAENTIEKYDSDTSIEEHLTEFDETEATDNVDNNSKSEDSMDSQDISNYSKSEEFEISKDYQLEQTLPDTTPLPTFDDEFEELTEDKIISASKQAAEVTKLEGSANGSEAEEVLNSSLESQSSQVLPEVIEQSNLITDDHEDYNEQQDENTKYLLESEHPQHFLEPRLNTEDSSGTSEEPAPKLINSEIDAENSKPEESTASQEEIAIFLPKDDELGASKDSQLEKTQFETSPQENQVQLSSELLVSESVNENHNDKLKESWPTLGEDTNEENVLTQTIDAAPSSDDTKLVPSLSHKNATENKIIIKEHSDLVTQDFGVDQRESVKTEDHERGICEEDQKCVEDLTDNGEKEPSSKSLDEFSGDNVISSNVSEIPNEESEVNDGITVDTNQDDIKVDVRPLEETSENDDSVTSEESSPNVSTINYASEQEDSKTQCSIKKDIEGDSDFGSPKELEQNVPLLTPEPIVETSLVEKIEPETSSDEEKNLLVERSDSSFVSMKEHEDTTQFLTEYSEDGKTVNGIFRRTIIQATLDLDDHMFNGHSTKENSEIIISEAKMMRLDGDIVNSQSQVKIEDSVIELTKSEGKSEGLFQSLLETSEHKESHFDEAFEAKNIMQAAVKYVDSASEQSNYTKKLINPYLTERDLHESSEIASSVIDEDLVNTKQEVIETSQGLKINQKDQDAWSSDE